MAQTEVCATSFPKEQQEKQTDPKPIHEMPVNRRRVRRANAPQFSFNRVALLSRAQQEITQRHESAKQVDAVRRRKQIEERAVRIARHVNALPPKLPPRN